MGISAFHRHVCDLCTIFQSCEFFQFLWNCQIFWLIFFATKIFKFFSFCYTIFEDCVSRVQLKRGFSKFEVEEEQFWWKILFSISVTLVYYLWDCLYILASFFFFILIIHSKLRASCHFTQQNILRTLSVRIYYVGSNCDKTFENFNPLILSFYYR